MDFLWAVNSLILLVFAMIWHRKDGVNLAIKIALWLVTLANVFYMLRQAGYIIKVG